MVVFEVSVNGTHKYTAGFGDAGALQATVHHIHLQDQGTTFIEKNYVDVLGVHKVGEMRRWQKLPLRVGDEVVIKITERDDCDPATDTEKFSVEDGDSMSFDPEP